MKQHPNNVVTGEFQNALSDVFVRYAGSSTELESAVADFAVSYLFSSWCRKEMVTAKIGMHGPTFRGNLSLVARSATIEETADDFVVYSLDWISELANLVLGSLKKNLGEFGVTANFGLPKSRTGIHLQSQNRADPQVTFVVHTEFGAILAALNYHTPVNVRWERQPQLVGEDDGSVCLF